jgi:hypothetical protein
VSEIRNTKVTETETNVNKKVTTVFGVIAGPEPAIHERFAR